MPDDYFDFLINLALESGDYEWLEKLTRAKQTVENNNESKSKSSIPEFDFSNPDDVFKAIYEKYTEGYTNGYYTGFYQGCIFQYDFLVKIIDALKKTKGKS